MSHRYVSYQERVLQQNPKAATAWQARWEREFACRWEERGGTGLFPKMAPLRVVARAPELPLDRPGARPGIEGVHAQLDWLCARARGASRD